MRIGVLGTGIVGHAIAGKCIAMGREVMMGSRQAGSEKAVAWPEAAGDSAAQGSFEDAARFGEMVINATTGMGSLAALQAAGAENLVGDILTALALHLGRGGNRRVQCRGPQGIDPIVV